MSVSKKDDVEKYLNNIKEKISVFNVVFLDREANQNTLLELELTPLRREEYLMDLKVEDYCNGPFDDKKFAGLDLWEFGKVISSKNVYIKICMGFENKPVICVSFHIAKHKITYPFKRK